MPTITTLCSGGEGVGVGAQAAGLTHLEGFELQDDIAQVARSNGFNVLTASILDVDPATRPVPDVLHASPECKNASNANAKGEESTIDVEVGRAVARFIEAMRPKVFTLENVYFYRTFEAFRIILAALDKAGYWWDYSHINAADFGVPQTRRRLILRAVRGGLVPMLPRPEPWQGWYEAIEDLIPGLPESQFAEWQLRRMPAEFHETALFDGRLRQDFSDFRKYTLQSEPAATITTLYRPSHMPRAFLMPACGNTNFAEAEEGKGCRYENEPSTVVSAGEGGRLPRAFLVDDQRNAGVNGLTNRQAVDPCFTVSATETQGAHAFLVDGQNARPDGTPSVRPDDEPSMTITGSARPGNQPRAWLSLGRVVKMTPRALARFQSFPDSYVLPDKAKLACRVIGNAVPPLLYQKIVAQLLSVL